MDIAITLITNACNLSTIKQLKLVSYIVHTRILNTSHTHIVVSTIYSDANRHYKYMVTTCSNPGTKGVNINALNPKPCDLEKYGHCDIINASPPIHRVYINTSTRPVNPIPTLFCHTINLSNNKYVRDSHMPALARCRVVKLANCSITDNGLKYLAACHKVDISMCKRITDAGVSCLTNCQVLDISCTNVAADSIISLSKLHTVYAFWTSVDITCISTMSGIKKIGVVIDFDSADYLNVFHQDKVKWVVFGRYAKRIFQNSRYSLVPEPKCSRKRGVGCSIEHEYTFKRKYQAIKAYKKPISSDNKNVYNTF